MRAGGRARRIRFLGLAAVALAGCIPQAQSAQLRSHDATVPNVDAQRELEARIRELGRGFEGEVGIAVRDVETGWTTNWHGDRFYPQQSVSKFWVALTALSAPTPASSTSTSASP